MPKKSVREMNRIQRLSNSLGARSFHMILLLVIVLGAAAITFGYYLYSETIDREFRMETWHMARSATLLFDRDMIKNKADQILEIYDSIADEDRLNDGRALMYTARFAPTVDNDFQTIRAGLHTLRRENNARAAYLAALDTMTNRMIFLVDSDPNKETFCPPGSYDEYEKRMIDDLLYGAEVSRLDSIVGYTEPVNAIVVDLKEYGNRCVAGAKICKSGRYHVMMFVDTDMELADKAIRRFLIQYILLLLIVGVILAIAVVRRMKKTIAMPVNRLAEAALAYATDRQSGITTSRHFDDLNIRTGDEIENLALIMQDMESELGDYEENLTRVTAEKERINTELDVASKIQDSMVPHIFPAFPEREEFDIHATMNTAKEVGGDFYDFFLIDEDHLALVMADVSGKGIPAALFMMACKILIKNYSFMEDYSPAKILTNVNEQICSTNEAEMFVTVWLGILEISTGKLTAANAGHEYPAICRCGGRYELFKDKHGFVIGGMPGLAYTEYEIKLEPGDAIYQYTDGVTEATDDKNNQFGTDRMLEALNREPDAASKELLANVQAAIEDFTLEADQFDDITMLSFRYHGTK